MNVARVPWFTCLLTVATAVLVAQSLTLSPASRQAPLPVALVTLALLVLQLLVETLPGVAARLSGLQTDSLFGASRHLETWRRSSAGVAGPADRAGRAMRIAAWISGFAALVWGLGLLAAVPIFLLPYLRTDGGLGWTGASTVTAVTAGLLYLVFEVLLGLPLPEGALG